MSEFSNVRVAAKAYFVLTEDVNVALTSQGTKMVTDGMSSSALDGDFENKDNFTSHEIGNKEGITLKLRQPFLLNRLKMLLYDKDGRSYSYYVEVSINGKEWLKVWDRSNFYCRSWQWIGFPPMVIQYIRIVGTRNTVGNLFEVVFINAYLSREPVRTPTSLQLVEEQEPDHPHDQPTEPSVYLGMLKYQREDLREIMRALIHDLQPAIALSAQPSGLPAYILIMMIRYADYINDKGNQVRHVLISAFICFKSLMKTCNTLDYMVFWLSNFLRLLHNMKQYSGDTAFQSENTPKQNEQCLKGVHITEYQQYHVLDNYVVFLYTKLIKTLEQDMQKMIVPAILESTGIQSGGGLAVTEEQKPLDILVQKFETTYNLLCSCGLDENVINQVFRQLFYYVCAEALNNLLVGRELPNLSKGSEIRYNISILEEWGKTKKMEEVVKLTLAPVIQASQILQVTNCEKYVASICEIGKNLTIQQVEKLFEMYSNEDGTGASDVSKKLVEKVRSHLFISRASSQEGQKALKTSTLLMDTQHIYPIDFPFNPSSVQLELINIPDSFGLSQWLKKM